MGGGPEGDLLRGGHLRKNSDQAIVLANANLFETSWYMRGLEQAFEDMMLRPDLIHLIMDRVTAFFTAYFYKILKRCPGEIDMVFTADDIGHQDGLLLSLEMWEEFIKPYHVRSFPFYPGGDASRKYRGLFR